MPFLFLIPTWFWAYPKYVAPPAKYHFIYNSLAVNRAASAQSQAEPLPVKPYPDCSPLPFQ